ncbi:hypothetical protein LOZ57_002097 [Ophidiomyces ophidiicola]|uniref:uncharacterized protein n=1 Tax=Ophidiomyces ophidiicola TaxID=1387563 RepID=UPI0020C4CE9C|nr:uncharacterized protein LOZ57_002097 [Ophidiomyces ophidiicola]KAI1950535.1 hypothetical protein LOZ57_002097 [Ophidiomyces ophidiicola]KAI2047381.1 hypothetical protein LOZ43_005644 [Ophidiomyces ophidiicola]
MMEQEVGLFAMATDNVPPPESMSSMDNMTHYACKQNVNKTTASVPADTTPEAAEVASPGILDRLPLELTYEICYYLDLDSLVNFSCVSKRYQEVVDSFPLLCRFKEHAADLLEAITVMGVSRFHTMTDVYEEFTQPYCRVCGKFGGYVFLPLFARCCYNCHYFAQELALAPLEEVVFNYILPDEIAKKMPVVRNVAGWLDTLEFDQSWDEEEDLASVFQAEQFALELHGGAHNIKAAFADRKARISAEIARLLSTRGPGSQYSALRDFIRLHPGFYGLGRMRFRNCYQFPSRRRSLSSLAFPWYNPMTNAIEPGLYCRFCTMAFDYALGLSNDQAEAKFETKRDIMELRYHEQFLKADAKKHFATCPIKAKIRTLPLSALTVWPFDARSGRFYNPDSN